MKPATELSPEQLYRHCDPSALDFSTTAELEGVKQMPGTCCIIKIHIIETRASGSYSVIRIRGIKYDLPRTADEIAAVCPALTDIYGVAACIIQGCASAYFDIVDIKTRLQYDFRSGSRDLDVTQILIV